MENIKLQPYSFVALYSSFNIITSLGCCADVTSPGSWRPGKQILSPLKVAKNSIVLHTHRQVRLRKKLFCQLTTYIIDGGKIIHFSLLKTLPFSAHQNLVIPSMSTQFQYSLNKSCTHQWKAIAQIQKVSEISNRSHISGVFISSLHAFSLISSGKQESGGSYTSHTNLLASARLNRMEKQNQAFCFHLPTAEKQYQLEKS